jgi:hypothetical protein
MNRFVDFIEQKPDETHNFIIEKSLNSQGD